MVLLLEGQPLQGAWGYFPAQKVLRVPEKQDLSLPHCMGMALMSTGAEGTLEEVDLKACLTSLFVYNNLN